MASRLFLITGLLFTSANFFGQNWRVFNPAYRYNYKFDFNPVVTNVIFADSVTNNLGYTSSYMNRIGVECTGPCYWATNSLVNTSDRIILPDMPQFLQKTITCDPNGLYYLEDTAQFVINPQCQISQSWLFDSSSNISATCVAMQAAINFGQNDSLKTILLTGGDTIRLSRNFGIMQFPMPYQKNKYYRLAGIEKAGSYDSAAFMGERVPNAWDIYKFSVGDKFCFSSFVSYSGPFGQADGCDLGNYTILNAGTIAGGYEYLYDYNSDTCYKGSGKPFSGTITAKEANLSSRRIENLMYPGMVYGWIPNLDHYTGYPDPNSPVYNIARFFVDTFGTFYKYGSYTCPVIPHRPFSPGAFHSYNETGSGYLLDMSYSPESGNTFGVGLGELTKTWATYGEHTGYCVSCAVKGGKLYFGAETFVGMEENQKPESRVIRIFPNPSSDKITIVGGDSGLMRVTDILGKVIKEEKYDSAREGQILKVSELSEGIYILSILYENGSMSSLHFVKE
jgi:hypothetical protein